MKKRHISFYLAQFSNINNLDYDKLFSYPGHYSVDNDMEIIARMLYRSLDYDLFPDSLPNRLSKQYLLLRKTFLAKTNAANSST